MPAAALVGAGLAAGDVVMTLDALRRVAVDAVLVVVLGATMLALKQLLVHHRRSLMM